MKTALLAFLGIAIAHTAGAYAQGRAAGPPPPCTPAGEVRFVCGLQAPEDLVVVPGAQWVVAGAYGGNGGLYLVRASDHAVTRVYPADGAAERFDKKTYAACPGPADAATKAKYQTHGLYLLAGNNSVHRLFVVLHGGRESVEVFEIDARQATPRVTWIGCAVAPPKVGLNSVRGLPDGGFIATNFLEPGGFGGPAMKAMMSGEKNGELWEWHPGKDWQKLPATEAAGANGLELSEDGRTIYVAAWGTQSFFRVGRGDATPARQGTPRGRGGQGTPARQDAPGGPGGQGTPARQDAPRGPASQGTSARQEIPLGFRVDNIRWAADGTILATGQAGDGPQQASVVVKIHPQTLAVREILRYPNTPAFGAGTVAVEVGKDLWVGSYRGDRLAIFPMPR